jgi:hypothetical protein
MNRTDFCIISVASDVIRAATVGTVSGLAVAGLRVACTGRGCPGSGTKVSDTPPNPAGNGLIAIVPICSPTGRVAARKLTVC